MKSVSLSLTSTLFVKLSVLFPLPIPVNYYTILLLPIYDFLSNESGVALNLLPIRNLSSSYLDLLSLLLDYKL